MPATKPTLALSMIVRDAELSLAACLDSVRGIVDEIVIADTGSTDDTIEVGMACGAHVIPIPWADDFAEARNRALLALKSDWVLVLDADEQLDAAARQALPRLLAQKSVAAYTVTIRNYVSSLESRIWDRAAVANDSLLPSARSYPAYVESESVRLFRRDRELYFAGRVRESIHPRIVQTGRRLGNAPFFIHHFGLVANAEVRARKNHFYRRLGQLKLRDTPQDAKAFLELGLLELDDFASFPAALDLFERACELDPQSGNAFLFHGLALAKLHRWREALQSLAEAERHGCVTSLVCETQGDAHYNLKDYAPACKCYDRALHRSAGNPMLHSKLGLAIVRAGNADRGLRLVRQAVEAQPTAGELHDRLILTLVWLDRIEQAAVAADAKLDAMQRPEAVDFLRAASLWARVKNWACAASDLQAGLRLHPRDITLGRSLAEVRHTAVVPHITF